MERRLLSMAMEVKVMDMAQFAEILKSDQRNVSSCNSKQQITETCKKNLLPSSSFNGRHLCSVLCVV